MSFGTPSNCAAYSWSGIWTPRVMAAAMAATAKAKDSVGSMAASPPRAWKIGHGIAAKITGATVQAMTKDVGATARGV